MGAGFGGVEEGEEVAGFADGYDLVLGAGTGDEAEGLSTVTAVTGDVAMLLAGVFALDED